MNVVKKVEIWSTYPPPYGGVSIHSKRLFETLKNSEGIELIFKNFNGSFSNHSNHIIKINNFSLEFLRLFLKKCKIIHLHSNNVNLWMLLGLIMRHHKFIITIHNQNLKTIDNWLKKILIKRFLKRVRYIILNDSTFSKFLINEFCLNEEQIKKIPAFIPPLASEEIGLSKEFLKFRSKFTFVISSYAWKLTKKKNVDIYGIQQIILSLDLLVKKGYSIGLIIILPIIENQNYYKEILEEIKELNLQNNILIFTQNIPNAFEIWKLSNVFIRATSTDIEGISLKEALYYDIPVVASDVIERPKEVILYKHGNLIDLTEKIISALNIKKIKSHRPEINTCDQILLLYKSI